MNPLSLLLLPLCCVLLASSQDSGQKAASLAPLVKGTLPAVPAAQQLLSSPPPSAAQGLITVRAANETSAARNLTGGAIYRLGLASGRDGYVMLPPSYGSSGNSSGSGSGGPSSSSARFPLVVTLHAAGKGGLDGLGVLSDAAQAAGVVLLAPESRGATWTLTDSSETQFGGSADVAFISAALTAALGTLGVDRSRMAMGGFSDGASFALTLGLANGNLFPSTIALSPGGWWPLTPQGQPRIFLSAGIQDNIFPINNGGGDTVYCRLQALGFSPTYVRFDGKHVVPPDVASKAVQWFLGASNVTSENVPASLCSASSAG